MKKIELLEHIKLCVNPFAKEWITDQNTNCYAYALGLDISSWDIFPFAYELGSFSMSDIDYRRSYDDLIKVLKLDLEALDIQYKFVLPSYKLSDNEWKIAVFSAIDPKRKEIVDFHFMRQTKSGIWTHKVGTSAHPTDMDDKNRIILSPEIAKCSFKEEELPGQIKKYDYSYGDTLCLKLGRK